MTGALIQALNRRLQRVSGLRAAILSETVLLPPRILPPTTKQHPIAFIKIEPLGFPLLHLVLDVDVHPLVGDFSPASQNKWSTVHRYTSCDCFFCPNTLDQGPRSPRCNETTILPDFTSDISTKADQRQLSFQEPRFANSRIGPRVPRYCHRPRPRIPEILD